MSEHYYTSHWSLARKLSFINCKREITSRLDRVFRWKMNAYVIMGKHVKIKELQQFYQSCVAMINEIFYYAILENWENVIGRCYIHVYHDSIVFYYQQLLDMITPFDTIEFYDEHMLHDDAFQNDNTC